MTNQYGVISDVVKKIAKENDIKNDDALPLFYLRDVLGLEQTMYEEALNAGGRGDCGIDAFWVEEQTINIVQSKFYSQKNKVSEEEIDTFHNTLSYLRNPTELNGRCKRFIQERAIDFDDNIRAGMGVRMILLTTSTLEKAAEKKANIFQKENPDIRFEVVDIEELYKQYQSSQTLSKPDVSLRLYKYFEEHDKQQKCKYVIANLSGRDLFKAYKEHKGALLALNLRFRLPGGNINKGVIETLKDSNTRKRFWYYNNGLTIMCEKLEVKDEVAHLKNMQIVNGGQTTTSIYEAGMDLGSPESLDDVRVLARIIETNDDPLIEKIREFNNKQNPTKPRDFVVHDQIQKRLQTDFEALGVFYEVARGQSKEIRTKERIKNKKLKKTVDNLTVAQAHRSFQGYPAQAKSQKGSLLDKEAGIMTEIFKIDTTARELLFSFICYEKAQVEYKKNRKKTLKVDQDFLLHGTTHIVAAMGIICKQILPLQEIYRDREKFNKYSNGKVIDVIYDWAADLIGQEYESDLDRAKIDDSSLVPSKHFKNGLIAERMLAHIEKTIKKRKQEDIRKEIEVVAKEL